MREFFTPPPPFPFPEEEEVSHRIFRFYWKLVFSTVLTIFSVKVTHELLYEI